MSEIDFSFFQNLLAGKHSGCFSLHCALCILGFHPRVLGASTASHGQLDLSG